jgi:hypothetical protein
VQLFPERDHRSRRLLVLALALSLVLHFAGGSLWAVLMRTTRALMHEPEQVAQTQKITIERLPSPTPTPAPTPTPSPPPRVVQNRPHTAEHPKHQTLPRLLEKPRLAQPTFAPRPEPTVVQRIAKIHVPRTQRVALVRVPRGVRGSAPASGTIDTAALDNQFRQTIAQAQHDVEATPQPERAPSQTMKRYDKYLAGNIEDVTDANGDCYPLDYGSVHSGYTWYYLRCTVRYADGYVESVEFPWPFKFTRANDPFARRDGRRHEFPGQPPPDGFTLPHPFALSRAVCVFYRAECKAVIDRERANGELPAGS